MIATLEFVPDHKAMTPNMNRLDVIRVERQGMSDGKIRLGRIVLRVVGDEKAGLARKARVVLRVIGVTGHSAQRGARKG